MKSGITIRNHPKRARLPSLDTEIVILGLTPGDHQHNLLATAKSSRHAAFDGQMRSTMHRWFEWLGVVDHLKLEDQDSLFVERRFAKIVYTSSLIRDTVSNNGKNWTGRSPFPWNHDTLNSKMHETFKRLSSLEQSCLIVPLGDVVSEAIERFSHLDESHFVLHGFPHPSGANGHRNIKWANEKHRIRKTFRAYLQFREDK